MALARISFSLIPEQKNNFITVYTVHTFDTAIKTHKGDEKWPFFVNKQLFWWSALKKFLQTFSHFSHFILYHIPQLA